MTTIKTMEVLKQFAFGTVFFLGVVTIHMNFTGSNTQKNLVYQQQNQVKQEKVEMRVLDEELAMNQSNKTAKL